METTGTIGTASPAPEPGFRRDRAQLEAELGCLQAEIRNYLPPIPACDAYFNHLLEERGRIADELARLDAQAPQVR